MLHPFEANERAGATLASVERRPIARSRPTTSDLNGAQLAALKLLDWHRNIRLCKSSNLVQIYCKKVSESPSKSFTLLVYLSIWFCLPYRNVPLALVVCLARDVSVHDVCVSFVR